MNKIITFLPKSLLNSYVRKHFSEMSIEDFLLIYDKVDIPYHLFENNALLNTNEEVLYKMLDKYNESYKYFNESALTEKNIQKIANSGAFVTDKDIEKFPQLLTNVQIVKSLIERYNDIIKIIPESVITKELVDFLQTSYHVLDEEEILKHELFFENEILVKKSLKKYPNLILKLKNPSEDLMWFAKDNGFEPKKEHFYSHPHFKQSKSLLLKAFENDASVIVFFPEELLDEKNILSACKRNFIAEEKDLLENPNLCKISNIMHFAISNNPSLIKYIKCHINYSVVEKAVSEYKITKDDILNNPFIAKTNIMSFFPEYRIYDFGISHKEKINVLSEILSNNRSLLTEEIPFLDYRFGGKSDLDKLESLKQSLLLDIDEKNLEIQQKSMQTLDKIIDGIVNIRYIQNKFTFKYPDIVSLNDKVIEVFSEVIRTGNYELLSKLVYDLDEFVAHTIDKQYIEEEINKFYYLYKEEGINGFYQKSDTGEIIGNITTIFYNKILNQHRNHFMSDEKAKIEKEVLTKLKLTEKKENAILNGRKIEKIKRIIISKEFNQIGITEEEFNNMLYNVKNEIMSNKDIKKQGVIISNEQFELLERIFKGDGTLNYTTIKNYVLKNENDDVIKYIINKYEQIKFKLVKQVNLTEEEKYISNYTKESLKGINPTNFVIGDKNRYYENLADLLLNLNNEKLDNILENKDLLNEIKILLPFVGLIPELDIETFEKIITDYDRIRDKIVDNNNIHQNCSDAIITKIEDVINLANAYSSLDDISLFALGRNIVSMVNEINGNKYLEFYLRMLQRQEGNIPPIYLETNNLKFESGLYSDADRLLVGKIPRKDSCIDLLNSAGYATFEEILLKNSGDVILVRDNQNKLINRILLFRRGNIVQMVTASGETISLETYKKLADMIINQSIINNDNIDYVFVNAHSTYKSTNEYQILEDSRFITNFSHADFGKNAYLVSSKNMLQGIREPEISLKFDEIPKMSYQKSRRKILYQPTESDISKIRALDIVMELDQTEKEKNLGILNHFI